MTGDDDCFFEFVPLGGEKKSQAMVMPSKQDVGTSKGFFSKFLKSTTCFWSGSPPDQHGFS